MLAVEMVGRKAAEFPRLRPGRRLDITDNPQQSAFHSGFLLFQDLGMKRLWLSLPGWLGMRSLRPSHSSWMVRQKKPMRQHSSPSIRHAGPNVDWIKLGQLDSPLFSSSCLAKAIKLTVLAICPLHLDILWGTDKG